MNWYDEGYTEVMMYEDPGEPGYLENNENLGILGNLENQENLGQLEILDQIYDTEFFNCTQV